MLWQYRTVLFEFTKDGILGDRYVDDEEMEKTLNQLGRQSWELVNVSLLQDGLLAFLKRVVEDETEAEDEERVVQPQRREEQQPPPSRSQTVEPAIAVNPPPIAPRPPQVDRQPLRQDPQAAEEPTPRRNFDRPLRSRKENDDNDFVGGIRIS